MKSQRTLVPGKRKFKILSASLEVANYCAQSHTWLLSRLNKNRCCSLSLIATKRT